MGVTVGETLSGRRSRSLMWCPSLVTCSGGVTRESPRLRPLAAGRGHQWLRLCSCSAITFAVPALKAPFAMNRVSSVVGVVPKIGCVG